MNPAMKILVLGAMCCGVAGAHAGDGGAGGSKLPTKRVAMVRVPSKKEIDKRVEGLSDDVHVQSFFSDRALTKKFAGRKMWIPRMVDELELEIATYCKPSQPCVGDAYHAAQDRALLMGGSRLLIWNALLGKQPAVVQEIEHICGPGLRLAHERLAVSKSASEEKSHKSYKEQPSASAQHLLGHSYYVTGATGWPW